MHEIALAEAIAKAVEEELGKHRGAKVIRVSVQVGGLHEIVPDALEFGFSALIADTPLAGAELLIEKVPLRGQCNKCGHEFEIEDFMFICPQCYSSDIKMIRGDELKIAYIEIDTA